MLMDLNPLIAREDQARGFRDRLVGKREDPRFHHAGLLGLSALALQQAGGVDAEPAHAGANLGPFLLEETLALVSPSRARAPGATNMPTPRLTTTSPSSWKP